MAVKLNRKYGTEYKKIVSQVTVKDYVKELGNKMIIVFTMNNHNRLDRIGQY